MAEFDHIAVLHDHRTRLLTACQLAYRKHCLDDDSIGWEELGDHLYNALSEVMGDDGFCKFLEQHRHLAERLL